MACCKPSLARGNPRAPPFALLEPTSLKPAPETVLGSSPHAPLSISAQRTDHRFPSEVPQRASDPSNNSQQSRLPFCVVPGSASRAATLRPPAMQFGGWQPGGRPPPLLVLGAVPHQRLAGRGRHGGLVRRSPGRGDGGAATAGGAGGRAGPAAGRVRRGGAAAAGAGDALRSTERPPPALPETRHLPRLRKQSEQSGRIDGRAGRIDGRAG